MTARYFIKPSRNGLGVYLEERFLLRDHRGPLFSFTGPRCTAERLETLVDKGVWSARKESVFYQIGAGVYIDPIRIGQFINHSCSPNMYIEIAGEKVVCHALRDIAVDEEVTFDYSTNLAEERWEMPCRCGEACCRGRIRDFRHLPELLKAHYLKIGNIPDFVRCHSAGVPPVAPRESRARCRSDAKTLSARMD